jgi:MFS family permease
LTQKETLVQYPLIMSSTDGTTTPNEKSLSGENLDQPLHGSDFSGPGGAGEPDASAFASNFSSSFQEALFILLIGLSQLFAVGGLGNTAFPVAQIGRALNATSIGQMSWFLASYSLCSGVFVVFFGRIGDHFGSKYVFLFGWLWLAIWSLVCGFANNVILFDFARGMAGIGIGALVPNSIALLGRAFPPFSVKKNISFAILGFCAPAGYIFGGLIGGGFAQGVTWRWSFWFWAIGCLILGLATLVIVPDRVGGPVAGLTFKDFDYLGLFLGVTGLTLFSFAWNQAAVVGWEEPYTYALLIVGVFFISAFVVSQSRVAAPILPNELWKRKGFAPVIGAMAFGWMSFGIFLYYTTTYLLIIRKVTPLTAVAQMTPLVIGGLVATACVGIFINRVSAQWIFGASMLSFLIGDLLMSFFDYSTNYWAFVFPACLLVVGGPDLSFASSGIIISNVVLPEEQGVAGSLVSAVVHYSLSIGLGIAATVETHVDKHGSDIVAGFEGALWLGIGFAAVALLIVVLFVRDHRFDHKTSTNASGSSIQVPVEVSSKA